MQWRGCAGMCCGSAGRPIHLPIHDIAKLTLPLPASFYPLFPSPSAPPLEPLNLDVTHSDLLRFDQGTGADIFIMPSMLKHFAKVVDSAVMVNPATMTRRNQPGTFAKMTIYPTPRRELEETANNMAVDDEDEEKALEHRVYERMRVDIVRV